MLNKNGFTLAELLVAIAVVGIISTLLISLIAFNKPNKNKALIRKDYYVIEKALSSMMIENDYFPMGSEANENRGFAHPPKEQLDSTNIYNIPNFPAGGMTVTNPMRFCYEFTNFLNVIDRSGCSFVSADTDSPFQNVKSSIQNNTAFDDDSKHSYNFKLQDGSEWIMSDNTICDPLQDGCNNSTEATKGLRGQRTSSGSNYGAYTKDYCIDPKDIDLTKLSSKVSYTCLFVDTNGFKNPPNYMPVFDTSKKTMLAKVNNNEDRDRFVVIIGYDGKMYVPADDGTGADDPNMRFMHSKNSLGNILKSKLLF